MNPFLEWKPMSEAPKDGTRILVLDEDHNAWVASWDGRYDWQVTEYMDDTRVWSINIKDPIAWSRLVVPLVYPCHCGGLFWIKGGDVIADDIRYIKFAVCDKCEILLREQKECTISETIRNYNRRKDERDDHSNQQ
jgi:hypothetical protein